MWLAFASQTRELRDGEVVVGSGADADWRISTADLMPRHFIITVYGLNASLRPASKDTVVVVNDQQLVGIPRLLNDDDLILAGSGRFLFCEASPRGDFPTPKPTQPTYLVNESSNRGRQLVSRSTMLGRDASSAITIDDPSASRFHAEVRREAGGFALHSMGSAGTLLNGRRILGPSMLSDGDVIEIASRRWRFTRDAPPPSAPGPRENPTGPQWRARAPETGTIDVVAGAAPRRGQRVALLLAALIAILAIGFLIATRA